jgi:hypothetical protein
MLWLPVNPVLGVVMPFCKHNRETATRDVNHVAGAVTVLHKHSEHGFALDKTGKRSCVSLILCHLASASVITSFYKILSTDLKADVQPFSVMNINTFVPERPERPPRLQLA